MSLGTFVLVHGAMHGGWCWRDVGRHLVGEGHEAYAPTLTGQGARRSSLTPEVGVERHVADVVDTLWFDDLHGVTLVLHSYAGMLAGPIAEQAGDRLSGVVFLAAFVADSGQSLLDVEPPEVAERYRRLAVTEGDGWLLRADPAFLDRWGVPERLQPFVGPRLTDFPFRCQTDRPQFDPSALARLPCAFVAHTAPPLASLDRSRAVALDRGWVMREVERGHDMMLEAPRETAALLTELAELHSS